MIRTRGLTKAFGSVRALDGLDMDVPAGSVYGLVGPNGAGKTTLLQHVAGVMRQDAGEVLVDGAPVFENPAVKGRIAYVASEPYSFRQARVSDLRRLHASLEPRFDVARFDELASLFALDEDRLVRSLSKGMRRQLASCLAFAQRPEVLLLDEPLDGLDPSARRVMLAQVMDDVARTGMTVLVSSHNLRELTDVCDHVGIMEAGRMRLERSLEDLQGGFVKAQVAFPDGADVPSLALDVLHEEVQGRLRTLVVRGAADQVESALGVAGATFVNVLP
ncbi:MAG: ABC transporter ATP-binding protein, partial [Olsenella sp.]|nr:ABC transporter ATP-binding protein [Olsenella sp.]